MVVVVTMRTIENLETEIEKMEALIVKKKQETFKLEQKIEQTRNLISKKKNAETRTVKAYVVSFKDRLTTIRIIDTGETHSYWGYNKPETYIKITTGWLEQLRDCKRRRDAGEFNQ